MKAKIYILFLLFLSALFVGCSAEDSEMDMSLTTPGEKKTQVVLTLSIPAVSIPQSTRAITKENESAINELTIWVFDNKDNFLYQVSSKESEDDGTKKVVIRESKIYATLRESDTPVKLAMIANTPVNEPQEGQKKADILNDLTFTYSPKGNEYIPMYGETQTPFIVKEGATPEGISLKRALARIEVDAANAFNFTLESAMVVNINTQGTIVQSSTIKNSAERIRYEANAVGNKWLFYIPEATNVDSNNSEIRTSVILKGRYKNNATKYYRLDFIKRTQNGTDQIQYEYIKTINRNHRYVFHIENIVEGAGHSSLKEALSEDADNKVLISDIMVIDDENIRDITTDSQYYLGITSDNLIATKKEGSDGKYYSVNMSIVTNNDKGWVIEDLPSGVEVSAHEMPDGQKLEEAFSVWVYISTSSARPGDIRTIYIYSGNIRKTINIKIK